MCCVYGMAETFSKGVKFASVPDNWKKAVYSLLIQKKTARTNEKP